MSEKDEKTCETCGGLFTRSRGWSRALWEKRRTCSAACLSTLRLKIANERDRTCTICKRHLPADSFAMRTAEGRRRRISRCRGCARVVARAAYQLGLYHTKNHASSAPRDPLRLRARRQFKTRVEAGHIQRQPCEKCGAAKTDGHHEDYTKPLEVRWLCRRCHGREHRAAVDTPLSEQAALQMLAERRRAS